jgi:hypothetical protein
MSYSRAAAKAPYAVDARDLASLVTRRHRPRYRPCAGAERHEQSLIGIRSYCCQRRIMNCWPRWLR